jgi:heme A synthase
MTVTGLSRFSRFAACAVLLLVMTGAAITSSRDRPPLPWLSTVHEAVAIAVSLLLVVLVIALFRYSQWLIGWVILALLATEIVSGHVPKHPEAQAIWTLHAIFSAFLFASVAVVALITSPPWQRDPDPVQDYGWPSLRFLSDAAAVLVALQVGFGASMRHGQIGVMFHLLGALVVAIFIIIAGVFSTNQFPKHAVLRPLAVSLMVVTGIQVFLGMTTFLMRMMNGTGTIAWLIISVAHVVNGSLTFAASVLLAIAIRRDVRPREAERA